MSAMVAMPAFTFLTDPLRRTIVSGADQPVRVASPDQVMPGRPLRVTVYGERRDGWTRIERMKLGAAWLVRTAEGRVRAFSAACPHLGCGVDWNEKTEKFDCPCHGSGFALDGRCVFGPAPRGLDELEVVASAREIRIRYRRFKVGSKQKELIG